MKDTAGNWTVLYLYPKDNTSGCTVEANEFSEMRQSFAVRNTIVFGVSADSKESHRRFTEKDGLAVDLLSDTEKAVLDADGARRLKKTGGKEKNGNCSQHLSYPPR